MRPWLLTFVVFCASLLVLSWRIGEAGLATAYVDPVAKIQAQDEAVYAASSLRMAVNGDWMTPRLLGRYALYKPPLLYWLSAASVKALGRSALALRVPSLVAGAATVALVFLWLCGITNLAGALTGVILLLGSHLFFVLSRTGLTDALLTLETSAAMYALTLDPRLASNRALWTFGIASGAAIMTKGVAGVFPLLALAVICLISNERPALPRLARLAAITAAIAMPWHLWQMAQHPRWFWAEYILSEHVTWGFHAPLQSTDESRVLYYLKRLFALDPVLTAAAVSACIRVRPRIPLAWIFVVLGCSMAWQYRNASYLMPALPAMAILAASAIPRRSTWMALVLAAGLAVGKMFAPGASWGIPFAPESVNPAQIALDAYAARHRSNELILIEPDDQFYSATLGLPKVRYCYIDPRLQRPRLPLDFEFLGVTVTADEFERMNELRPVFAQRLREWGLDSSSPIATVILASSGYDISALIVSHPEADFYAESKWAPGDHDIWQPSGSRVFLLSRKVIQRP